MSRRTFPPQLVCVCVIHRTWIHAVKSAGRGHWEEKGPRVPILLGGMKLLSKKYMQYRERNVSTTDRGELFIAKGHGHTITAGFMLVINNWKVKVKRGYLAIRVITVANKLPEGIKNNKTKVKKK